MTENELYHFGVKGMRWGVRKKYIHHPRKKKRIKEEPTSEKKRGLTDKQKKYLKVGAAVAVTALAAYGGYKLYQNKDYLMMKAKIGKKNVDYIKNNFDAEKGTFVSKTSVRKVDISKADIRKVDISKADIPKVKTELSDDLKHAINQMENDKYGLSKKIFDSKQLEKLNDSEIKAIRAYTTPLYKQANEVLRGDGEGTQAGKMIADGVKSALNKVELSSDVDLHRGVNQSTVRKIFGQDTLAQLQSLKSKYGDNTGEIMIDSLKGKSNIDHGIMSTAVPHVTPIGKKLSIADYFSGQEGVIFDIKASKGQHGMYISPLSENQAEREIIFAPGSAISLTGSMQIVDGIIHLGAMLIQ